MALAGVFLYSRAKRVKSKPKPKAAWFSFGKIIQESISIANLYVIINDSSSNEFMMQKRIQQGDPISPFLFNNFVAGLVILFSQEMASRLYSGSS